MLNRKSILFFVVALFYSILFSQDYSGSSPLMDLTAEIEPLGIVPYPQDGYGRGSDQLAQPDDVELLADGSMIVSDVDNNRIQHFSPAGELIRSITAEDLGLEESEIIPTGVAKDSEGYIYVTLEGVGRIARFRPDLTLDQFIGRPITVSAEEYYQPENDGGLIKPQGLIAAANGDLYVIDMAKKVFKTGKKRNFGFRKFKKFEKEGRITYEYDRSFAQSQEITKVMRKSEGMTISEDQTTLYIAEEKPYPGQFGNMTKKRYIAAFDLESGRFLDRLFGVTFENDSITGGYFNDSVEGLSVFGEHLIAVDEKAGRIYFFDMNSGECRGFLGKRAYYYCDDHSDCVIEGINYNEQTIIAGEALPHLKNNWHKNELASPDGVSATVLKDGSKRLAVVDQWNSRIIMYDLDEILQKF